MSLTYYLTAKELRGRVGLVVPVWFPPEMEEAEIEAILSCSLADVELYFMPADIVAVVDAAQSAERVLHRLREKQRIYWEIVTLPENRGKGGAVAVGLQYLLSKPQLEFFVIRDDDGDHFVNDVPHLCRLGYQIIAEQDTDLVLVNGGRRDLHRPLGFVRGQYEVLVNDIVWHALQFALARQGRVLNEQYLPLSYPVPDFQSGFKLYSRAAAEKLVTASENVEPGMLRWGCEVLAVVETLLAGGVMGEINRITLDAQPLSTYGGEESRLRIYGTLLRWALQRLGLGAQEAQQLIDNALARLLLRRQAEWREELLTLRRQVVSEISKDTPSDLLASPPFTVAFC